MDRTSRNKIMGKRQRRVIRDLGDRGVWFPGCSWRYGTDAQTQAVLATLVARGEVTEQDGRWWLAPRGYAWLVCDAANDMGMCTAGSKGYEIHAVRIARLASQARLAKDGPVNWRGEQV